MRGDVESPNFRRLLASTPILALALALLSMPAPRAQSQAGTVGRWTTLSYSMPMNPVHMALLKNGRVLIVSGSGNNPTESSYSAALWDPLASSFTTQLLGWDMFCNGMVTLPDGRVFINGGTLQYDPFHGERRNAIYDPATDRFTDLQNMAHGRWYPTTTLLGDGRVMTFSGLDETGATNIAVEFYTPGSGWSSESFATWTPPLYPRMHLLPDGRVLYSGSGTGSRFFTPIQQNVVGGRGHHQVQRHAHLRNLGAPAVDGLKRLQRPSDDSRRRQPGDQHDRDPRPVGDAAAMAVRPGHVATAHRNERDDPSEWQSARCRADRPTTRTRPPRASKLTCTTRPRTRSRQRVPTLFLASITPTHCCSQTRPLRWWAAIPLAVLTNRTLRSTSQPISSRRMGPRRHVPSSAA